MIKLFVLLFICLYGCSVCSSVCSSVCCSVVRVLVSFFVCVLLLCVCARSLFVFGSVGVGLFVLCALCCCVFVVRCFLCVPVWACV